MKHLESNFEGAKKIKIYYQAWLPDKPPKAIVQVVHGFAEHSGRYMNIVNQLVPLGYAIYADDHRGHGKSEGVINYVDSFDQFVEDEKKLYDIIKENHPKLPIFLLGHSMGSLIALLFTKKYENLLKGLILSGTGLSLVGKISSLLRFMIKIASKIAPKSKINQKLDPNMLTHDPEVVKAYIKDPLVHYKIITAKLGYELLNNARAVSTFVGTFKVPLLIQCGSEDQLVKGSEAELKSAFKMSDQEIHFYEGLYHEVYNETENERKKVLKDLSNWLEKHIK